MELHIAGQLRRTNRLAAQRPCPACSPASSSPVPRIRPGGRFVVQLARSSLPTGTKKRSSGRTKKRTTKKLENVALTAG
jgi:hypothetical protein